jgi:hypothetical protein|nr:MAG TPA_asm: hypothetical protein [Caudoviricetes sp.]
MAYKIILGDSTVDAQESLKYVCWNDTEKSLSPCNRDEANGIISSDELNVWHLDGLPTFSKGTYATVTAVEITEDEYSSLLNELNIVFPMTVREMRSKIVSLEDELSAAKILLGVE